MSSSRIVRVGFGAVIVALVAAGLLTFWMIGQRQAALDRFSDESVGFSVGEVVIAYERFHMALLQLQRSRTPADLAAAKQRLESP